MHGWGCVSAEGGAALAFDHFHVLSSSRLESDIELGRRGGIHTLLVLTGKRKMR